MRKRIIISVILSTIALTISAISPTDSFKNSNDELKDNNSKKKVVIKNIDEDENKKEETIKEDNEEQDLKEESKTESTSDTKKEKTSSNQQTKVASNNTTTSTTTSSNSNSSTPPKNNTYVAPRTLTEWEKLGISEYEYYHSPAPNEGEIAFYSSESVCANEANSIVTKYKVVTNYGDVKSYSENYLGCWIVVKLPNGSWMFYKEFKNREANGEFNYLLRNT